MLDVLQEKSKTNIFLFNIRCYLKTLLNALHVDNNEDTR